MSRAIVSNGVGLFEAGQTAVATRPAMRRDGVLAIELGVDLSKARAI